MDTNSAFGGIYNSSMMMATKFMKYNYHALLLATALLLAGCNSPAFRWCQEDVSTGRDRRKEKSAKDVGALKNNGNCGK